MKRPSCAASVCAATLLLAIAMAGCGSTPPTRYYSLLEPPMTSGNAATVMPAPSVRFDVLHVTVPVQVDVPQIVVRLSDDSMAVLENDRWIAPLGDEIRGVITLRIERLLATSAPGPAPVADRPWRVRLDVQRFDSMLGRAVSAQVHWALLAPGGGAALRCQANYERPVGSGASALAAGHRALFEQLGDVIGQALKTAASGGKPSCS
jgi:uncharacterized lipoprotein YmbA